jgi:hypothetical protein
MESPMVVWSGATPRLSYGITRLKTRFAASSSLFIFSLFDRNDEKPDLAKVLLRLSGE